MTVKSFAAGAAIGTILATAATVAVRKLDGKADRLCGKVEQAVTGRQVVHFRKPLDPVLLDHGRPVVAGDDPFVNPSGR
jgi:hypothetical protein